MKKQQKRKGFERYRMLSKKQQKQFRFNCIREEKTDSEWLQWRLNQVDTFKGFLTGSITLALTKQGFRYWNRIANLDK